MTKTRGKGNTPDSMSEVVFSTTMSDLPPGIDVSKLSADNKELFVCLSKYFHHLIEQKDQKINKLEEDVQCLKEKVIKLEDQIEDSEAYSRRDSLIVSGGIPDGSRDENCKSIVTNLLKDGVKIHIDPRDISIAHRIGNKRQQGPDKRNIIFKLCRRELKADIIYACRQQRPQFYINECLTPTRNKILYILRKVKKKYSQIKSVRTHDGSVYVYLPPAGRDGSVQLPLSQLRKLNVNSYRQLMKLLQEELRTNLEEFDVEWRIES